MLDAGLSAQARAALMDHWTEQAQMPPEAALVPAAAGAEGAEGVGARPRYPNPLLDPAIAQATPVVVVPGALTAADAAALVAARDALAAERAATVRREAMGGAGAWFTTYLSHRGRFSAGRARGGGGGGGGSAASQRSSRAGSSASSSRASAASSSYDPCEFFSEKLCDDILQLGDDDDERAFARAAADDDDDDEAAFARAAADDDDDGPAPAAGRATPRKALADFGPPRVAVQSPAFRQLAQR